MSHCLTKSLFQTVSESSCQSHLTSSHLQDTVEFEHTRRETAFSIDCCVYESEKEGGGKGGEAFC